MTNKSLVIYSLNKVGERVQHNKQILRDISLGFYLGAKIGMLDLNGADLSLHSQAYAPTPTVQE